MVYPDEPVKGITGVRPVSGEREMPGREHRSKKTLSKKPGKDSVDISSRARRLADIENFLTDGEKDESNILEGKE